MPYPPPSPWDYLRLAAAMLRWRLWRLKETKKEKKKNVQEYGEHTNRAERDRDN